MVEYDLHPVTFDANYHQPFNDCLIKFIKFAKKAKKWNIYFEDNLIGNQKTGSKRDRFHLSL